MCIKLNSDNVKEDIRYIIDNGKIIGKVNIDIGLYYQYITDQNSLDKIMGSKFSVFQNLYKIPEDILEQMINMKFIVILRHK